MSSGELVRGHRARLREKFIDKKISDYEVLELLLAYAIPRIDVKPIAKRLLMRFGGTHKILTAEIKDLMSVPGIGENTAIFIKAIYELMLIDYKSHMDSTPVFHDFKILENYCKSILSGKPREEFHILYLDAAFKLLSDDLHSNGTDDWAVVYPVEVVKRALAINAKHLILFHNHPSGRALFSADDMEITVKIQDMLETFDIKVFDHLLVAGDAVLSAKNMRLI